MLQSKSRITGLVRATVYGPDGEVKNFPVHPILSRFPKVIQEVAEKLLGIPVSGRPMVSENHNIVTDEGDALIVDMLVTTGTQTAVDNANGKIGVGTGFTSETKGTDALVTQTGSDEELDATYPLQKGAFLAANDNTVVYRATFEAADLDDTGIDEALLGNGTDTLAYAEITPAVNVTTADTLQVDWELTFLGS
jgi:hypothetical protein